MNERDQVFRISRDFFCIVGDDGHFKRISPSFERIFGYGKEELFEKPVLDFIQPEDRSQCITNLGNLSLGEDPVVLRTVTGAKTAPTAGLPGPVRPRFQGRPCSTGLLAISLN